MPDLAEPAVLRFDDFLLDRQAGTLSCLNPDGQWTTIQIGSRAFQILCRLADRRGEIVSQHEIMDAVWPNVAVEPNNLTVQISALRRVLDLDRNQGSAIQNIPGRGYRFIPAITETSLPTPASVNEFQPTANRRGVRVWAALCTATLLICIAVVTTWWHIRDPAAPHQQPNTTPTAQTGLPTHAVVAQASGPLNATLANAPRLSLVVLPLENLGGDGLDDHTVDAVTDDLTTHLSRMTGFLVIARNSASAYKGKPSDIRRVGEELGVRYAVEGSVRKFGGTLWTNIQLVSTETGTHFWADRFEVKPDAASYDDVRQIAFALQFRIVESESARSVRERPADPDVNDILLQARALYNLPPSPQNRGQMAALYERALRIDPTSVVALVGVAEALLDSNASLSVDDPTVPAKLRRAEDLITQAELLSPDDRQAMVVRVQLLGQQHRCSEVIPAAQRAIQAYPELTGTHLGLGICLMRDGRAAEAIPAFEQSIAVNPHNPRLHGRYRLIGYAFLFLKRYDDAILWFQKTLAANPADSAQNRANIRAAIAAAQALAGHTEEARASAAEATQLWPPLTARDYFEYNITNPVALGQINHMRDGLRLAGIRDHADEDAESGVVSDDALHTNYEAPTPTAAPGARTVRTSDLAALVAQRRPLLLDVGRPWGRSIPGAVALWGAGVGGSTADEYQDRLGKKVQQLTHGDRSIPVVTVGWNAERYQGRNLALRLVALGYNEVYWYRGGRESWEVAGLPQAELVVQDW